MSRCRFAVSLGFWTFRAVARAGHYAHACTFAIVPVFPHDVRRRRSCEGRACADPLANWARRWDRVCTSDWATGRQWGEIYRDGSPMVKGTKLCRGGAGSPRKVRDVLDRRCGTIAAERAFRAAALASAGDCLLRRGHRELCSACDGRGVPHSWDPMTVHPDLIWCAPVCESCVGFGLPDGHAHAAERLWIQREEARDAARAAAE